jgi:[ribosomal protein S5]-alanine N-acetyltransferase
MNKLNSLLKSKEFILRPCSSKDEQSILKHANDKHIYKYTLKIPHPYKLKHARQWIKHCKKLEKQKKKAEFIFAIDVDGSAVGIMSLTNLESHKAEIGYWIGKEYWGRGIVTKAVRLITKFGFNELKLKRIYANIFSNNKASARVLQKNGYKREGIMKKFHLKDGKLIDAILYAKIS